MMQPIYPVDVEEIDTLIDCALAEDLGSCGDATANSIIDADMHSEADWVAKEPGVLCGLFVAERVFRKIDSRLACAFNLEDGHAVEPGTLFGKVSGPVRGILSGERTALNFLQHLSGISTLTSEFVRRVYGTGVHILDTRKTTPGLRVLEKYAVRVGGGINHRFGLYDRILIKNNHIDAAGGIRPAVTQCLEFLKEKHWDYRIEVETRTLDEVREVLRHPVHRIMLDNMDIGTMKKAVALVADRVEIEASGNITLENVRAVAETGVRFISVGRLTHSAPNLDLSLRIRPRSVVQEDGHD